MSTTSPILLILGSGPNVGHHVIRAFAAKGNKVALASRRLKEEDSTADQIYITSDLSDPDSVINVFSKVKELLGLPSVVVYNVQQLPTTPRTHSLPSSDFTRDLNINTTSAFIAAQQTVSAFEQLPDSASKTFIYTENILNTTVMSPLMDLGIGKSATAHMIQSAAAAYKDRRFKCKFYYTDERKADGSAAYFDIDGEAHGELYIELAEAEEQGPWQQTFVKGVGYKKFVAG